MKTVQKKRREDRSQGEIGQQFTWGGQNVIDKVMSQGDIGRHVTRRGRKTGHKKRREDCHKVRWKDRSQSEIGRQVIM